MAELNSRCAVRPSDVSLPSKLPTITWPIRRSTTRNVPSPSGVLIEPLAFSRKLTRQRSIHRIRQPQQLLDAFDRNFFEIDFSCPVILWQKTPVGEGKIGLNIRFHLAAPGVPAHQSEFQW